MIVVSDTSPISNLIAIGQLELLHKLYQTIIIPDAVWKETMQLDKFGIDTSIIESSDWIKVQSPIDTSQVKFLLYELDRGEAEAIVLAREIKASYLLIDERPGTTKAHEMGIKTIGLLRILLESKKHGHVNQIRPLIDALQHKAKFWMSKSLIEHVLKLANEN